jgi:hypothetical protein
MVDDGILGHSHQGAVTFVAVPTPKQVAYNLSLNITWNNGGSDGLSGTELGDLGFHTRAAQEEASSIGTDIESRNRRI